MNTPNPLVPKGSLQEQSKKKSQVRLIVFSILAVHVIALGVLLIQGCKREEPLPTTPVTPTMPVDTFSNPPPVTPPPPTNPPPVAPNPVVPPTPPVTPIAPVTPPVTDTSAASEYIVAKGDTFAIIAKKHGVSVKAIEAANPGVDSRRLKIKQKLVIPPKPPTTGAAPTTSATTPKAETEAVVADNVYTVKKGDNLTKIAKAHGTTPKAIRAANNLKTDQIKLGQKLKVPAKSASSASAAPVAPTAVPSSSVTMPATVPAIPAGPSAPSAP